MILVDTSVWVDHLHVGDEELAALLDDGEVLIHPFVIGELALGNVAERNHYLAMLDRLPRITSVTDEEVLQLVKRRQLFGRGIGFIDAHLLAALELTPEAVLWTRDRRLVEAANQMGLASRPPHRA